MDFLVSSIVGSGSDTCKRGTITGARGYAEVQDIDFSASPLGKGKTTSQTVTILMIFGGFAVHGACPWQTWFTLTSVSG